MEKAKENNKKSVEAHTTHCKTPDFVKKRTKNGAYFVKTTPLDLVIYLPFFSCPAF